MKCKRCEKELAGKQTSYCSLHCSKLHLKSLWRKRRKEHLKEYNKKYRERGETPLHTPDRMEIFRKRGTTCERCGTNDEPQIHHIKPLINGGTHVNWNLMILCRQCHMKWHLMLKDFWDLEKIDDTLKP